MIGLANHWEDVRRARLPSSWFNEQRINSKKKKKKRQNKKNWSVGDLQLNYRHCNIAARSANLVSVKERAHCT